MNKNQLLVALLLIIGAMNGYSQTDCTLPLDRIKDKVKITPTKIIPTENNLNFYSPPPPPPPPPTGLHDKIVYWVHGMNGSHSSWDVGASYAKQTYKVKGFATDYTDSQTTLDNAAYKVNEQIENYWTTRDEFILPENESKTFIISHSLGGMVSKKVLDDYPASNDIVKGLVTFNTPHAGSQLANYMDGPLLDQLKDFAENSCNVLGAGPIDELQTYESGILLRPILGFLNTGDILGGLCENASNAIIPFIVNQISVPAVSELNPGNSALDIDDGLPSSRKMLFSTDINETTQEGTSAFYMFYSGANIPNIEPQFEAHVNHDVEYLKQYRKNKSEYIDKYLKFKRKVDSKHPWAPMWACESGSWPFCRTYSQAKRIRDKYARGRDQFVKINNYWEYMTGARAYEESEYGDCLCSLGVVHENVTEEECLNDPLQDCEQRRFLPYFSGQVLRGYDGFITVESQEAWEGVDDVYKVPFKGPNHLTIRNSSELQEALDYLFIAHPFFSL